MYKHRSAITEDTILRLFLKTGHPLYVVIEATRRSSGLQGKGSTFISQLFYLEYWTGPGNRTTTSRFAVMRSIDWANPAEVNWQGAIERRWRRIVRKYNAATLLRRIQCRNSALVSLKDILQRAFPNMRALLLPTWGCLPYSSHLSPLETSCEIFPYWA